ncbi:MAG: hypothetical protein ACK4N5_01505 [Myxococcales bacterium]
MLRTLLCRIAPAVVVLALSASAFAVPPLAPAKGSTEAGKGPAKEAPAADKGPSREAAAADKDQAPAAKGEAIAAKPGREPEALFKTLGCRGCHAVGAPFHKAILNAQQKPEKDVQQWILYPQKIRPGVQMPNFAPLMTEQEALEMAKWIKAGNPK